MIGNPGARAGTALSPEWDRGFDEAFTDLISGDQDLVRAEFDALIGANFNEPPAPPRPPAPPGPPGASGSPVPSAAGPPEARPGPGAATPASDGGAPVAAGPGPRPPP